MGTLDVVVGGQYGSEGKGHVTQKVVSRRVQELDVHGKIVNVRVAGPNAGHTVIDAGDRKWPMRQVPVGFSVSDAERAHVELAIAAGSEIDPTVLVREIGELRQAGLLEPGQLWVDPEATILTAVHATREAEDGLVARVGSTGKGVGAARADRLMRVATRVRDEPHFIRELVGLGVIVDNTLPLMQEAAGVVIEGTQGFGLGLHAGMYPYSTSSDCRAIDFLGMAGFTPWSTSGLKVWVTMRPFPIRVAGDSGPLSAEVDWQTLGLPEEKTTVTQKVRRVGLWDPALVRAAVEANGGGGGVDDSVVVGAFTMLDQVWPGTGGLESRDALDLVEPKGKLGQWLKARESEIGCGVDLVTTGPSTGVWLR